VLGARSGDPDACRKLVASFLPAIAGVAAGFPRGLAVDREELVQDGVAGLLVAARRYDPGLTTPFWAYASYWVRKAMQELVAELARPVALSDRAVRDLARLRTARREHLRAYRTEPTDAWLCRATGFGRAKVERLQATERLPRGLHEPLRSDGATADTVGDKVVDPVAEQAFEHVLDELEGVEVHDLAEKLAERERSVLYAHYGLGQPRQTLKQIGFSLGLTAERARQIEVDALSKLRESLA
jgi:RNA polymerase primary sigma factor